MNLWGTLLYVAANLIIALMVGCMLFSTFVRSSNRFRVAVGIFATTSFCCALVGLDAAFDLVRQVDFGELAAVGWLQVAQSIALAVMLVAMRLRQAEAGAHLHPRQRGDAELTY